MEYFDLEVTYETVEVDIFGRKRGRTKSSKERIYAKSEQEAKNEIAYDYRKSGLKIKEIT